MWRRGGVLVAVAVVCATACGGAVGVRHRVAPGENLYRIGKAYGVSHEELARRNGIADPARIEVGQTIFIPHARTHLPVEVITPVSAQADRPAPRELPDGPAPFIWPVTSGIVTSDFGARGESHHDGIDISAPVGTPVRAVRAGRVLYSDRLRGYGNLIIVDHGQGYATVYAHNLDNRAHAGDQIRQGEDGSRAAHPRHPRLSEAGRRVQGHHPAARRRHGVPGDRRPVGRALPRTCRHGARHRVARLHHRRGRGVRSRHRARGRAQAGKAPGPDLRGPLRPRVRQRRS
ncbi:MAG: M23 family metallopeptidase [Deltaproteobacteria bacterium]|nr:MAG: M23 family metallopeptidase [Deltaproteobacteria bacterium]